MNSRHGAARQTIAHEAGFARPCQRRHAGPHGWLDPALQRDPHYWPARINLAVAMERQGRPDEAIRQYERVIREWPRHWEAYRNLAALLEKQGRAEEAKHYQAEAERVKALREP